VPDDVENGALASCFHDCLSRLRLERTA
jgi:hypothetical protein